MHSFNCPYLTESV